MAAWSTLVRSASQNLLKARFFVPKLTPNNVLINQIQVRNMSGHMVVTASKWQWHKMKDLFHFYFLVAAIPLTTLVFLANVFIGPATLTPIPEGYVPKYWEYYRHPVTRWMARYLFHNPQMDYEKNMASIDQETQVMNVRKITKRVQDLQKERQDYKYNYFLPHYTFAIRESREVIRHDRDNMD